ncbi:unnamed protein product [Moneuplotes crassus]|uniref:Uncharacterized protein n=1 Tax=Euplotes crassus TaxID=5936 RepID=A0AAD1Y2B5_EUPCR|nr:unnamed protein product [Moneuplotes crassus]
MERRNTLPPPSPQMRLEELVNDEKINHLEAEVTYLKSQLELLSPVLALSVQISQSNFTDPVSYISEKINEQYILKLAEDSVSKRGFFQYQDEVEQKLAQVQKEVMRQEKDLYSCN